MSTVINNILVDNMARSQIHNYCLSYSEYVYMHMCMHICLCVQICNVCACSHQCVHICMSRPKVNADALLQVFCIYGGRISYWTWSSPIGQCDPHLCLQNAGITSNYFSCPALRQVLEIQTPILIHWRQAINTLSHLLSSCHLSYSSVIIPRARNPFSHSQDVRRNSAALYSLSLSPSL